jgi:hypothetical protein
MIPIAEATGQAVRMALTRHRPAAAAQQRHGTGKGQRPPVSLGHCGEQTG